jgi:chromosome segregation protein
MRTLKIADAGRAALVVASPAAPGMRGSLESLRPQLPEGAVWAPEVIDCPEQIRPALNRVLRDVALVADLGAAARLVAQNPELRAVTPDGDVLGAFAAAGGSGKATSYIEVQAAVDEAKATGPPPRRRSARSRPSWSTRGRGRRAQGGGDVAAAAKRAAEGERNAAARRLAELGAAARSAKAESERLGAARQKAESARETDLMRLAELEERLSLAESTPIDEEPSTEERDRWPRWCRSPGRTRWRYASPCVPPRSGSPRSPAGPTR